MANNKQLIAVVVGVALGACGTAAQAGTVNSYFDFNNAAFNGGVSQVVEIGAWDWSQTSFLAQNGNTAIENFAAAGCAGAGGTACDFTVHTHAVLTGVKDKDGNNVVVAGLNTSFEITTELAFRETVTSLSGAPAGLGTQATFATKPGAADYLNVYYSTTVNASDLPGYGFNDGTVILSGNTNGASAGVFEISAIAPVQLDQFPQNNATSDNYGDGSLTLGLSQLTLSGFGTQDDLNWANPATNPLFFLNGLTNMSFNNVSIALPFRQVNPSDCFSQTPQALDATIAVGTGECANIHVDGLYVAQLADPNGGYLPVTGDVNGVGPSGGGGADFVAQTDYNSSFVSVPAPGVLALMAIGLLGLGSTRSKARRA